MKKFFGTTFFILSFLLILINYYFIEKKIYDNCFCFSAVILLMLSARILIPFEKLGMFIFDINDWTRNHDVEDIVRKLRLRAILYNNISVIIFATTVITILFGFYILINPPTEENVSINLTIRISASVLLIFLVQILFNVFKYILRVAAFYNAKADAIEFNDMKPETSLEKIMELFTPEKYDISELQQTSIVDILKSKIVK